MVEEEEVSVVTAITLAINAMNEDESKVSASAIPWYVEAALGLLDFMPAALILIFCFVTSVSASIFRAWSCQAPSRTPAGLCRSTLFPQSSQRVARRPTPSLRPARS